MDSQNSVNIVNGYRVYYRDSDGAGNSAKITTKLFYRDVQGMKTVGSEWNSNTVNSPSTDNCTVTFYLSWSHISVVKAAKLDLAAFTAWSQVSNSDELMIGRVSKLSLQSCSRATWRERHEFVSMSFNLSLYT